MKRVESLLSEVNNLCKLYFFQKQEFKQMESIRNVFSELIERGYNITTAIFDTNSPEYVLLCRESKQDCDKMVELRKKKMEAINSSHFELAADLRFSERELQMKIRKEFALTTANKYFVLVDKKNKVIVYNDFDGNLNKFFKLT